MKNLVWIYRGALICRALAGGVLLPWCQTSSSICKVMFCKQDHDGAIPNKHFQDEKLWCTTMIMTCGRE